MKNKIIKTIMLVSSFILLTACNSNNCCSNSGGGTNSGGNGKGLRSEYSFDEKYFGYNYYADLTFNFNYQSPNLRLERKIGIPNKFDGDDIKSFNSFFHRGAPGDISYCPFTDIYVDEGIESVSIYYTNKTINLETIILPSTISDVYFEYCANLTSVSFLDTPNNLIEIKEDAFRSCKKLSNMFSIPESVTSIGGWAFCDCSSLTELNYDGTVEQWNQIKKGTQWAWLSSIEKINCADGIVEIDTYNT